MEIYLLSERLDDGQHPGAKLSAGCKKRKYAKFLLTINIFFNIITLA
jgi:hypothetical protein